MTDAERREKMRLLGWRGGVMLREQRAVRDPNYYKEIGRMGGLAKAANLAAQKGEPADGEA